MSSSMSGTLSYRRLRAPRSHGSTLVHPSWPELGPIIERNLETFADLSLEVQGRDLAALRDAARRQALQLACQYTQQYRDVPLPADADRFYLAGHQPELFHPGVWFKNFFLGHLAAQDGAVGLNLIIDNDLARAMAVRCPTARDGEVHVARVPLDRPGGQLPYEQRAVLDHRIFDSFADRLEDLLEPWLSDPVVRHLWPYARAAANRHPTLGLALAEARHRLEADWGLNTLELPLSELCDQNEFRWFACHLLAHLPRFCHVHNEALHQYREVHRLRSRSHPVPDLAIEADGWYEAPLWMWTDEQPRRRRVFVRLTSAGIEVSDRHDVHLRWPLSPDGSAESAVQAWAAARAAGIKLRPRALLTTMFARLCLGDLFVHGIGGSKYDQLTDELLRRFFGCEPPGYATVSATILLPLPRADVEPADVRRVEHCLRELRYHPERYAPATPQVVALSEQKQHWIEQDLPRGQRLPRHKAIEQINLQLQTWVDPQRVRLQSEREDLLVRLHDAQLLGSREFSFCLFPFEQLRGLLLDLSRAPT